MAPNLLLRLILLGLLAVAPFAALQADEVREQRQVTAVDVVVKFPRSGFEQWSTGQGTPKGLTADQFQVLVEGQTVPIIALEALEHQKADQRTPWRQWLYIDCRAISTADLRRTTALLHQELPKILELGPLGILIAEPAPRTLLAPTRDRALLEPKLSQLTLAQECRDDHQELRDALLRALANPPDPELARADMIRDTYLAERQIQRRSALAFLNSLTDEERAGGAQKVVYLLHNGFDQGDQFYRELDATFKTPPELGPQIPFEEAALLVAAYGWTVVPCTQSVAKAAANSLDLGPWAIRWVNGEAPITDPAAIPPPGVGNPARPWQNFLAGIRGMMRENRKPERAANYAELGQALLGQKKWAEAQDAFRRAIYHFDEGPKTRPAEARSWLGLGQALSAAGDLAAGRIALEHAYELDATLRPATGSLASTALGNRGLLLAALAQITLGQTALEAGDLQAMLGELRQRVRLTFQLAGDSRGQLLQLFVATQGGTPVGATPYVRSSTPEAVATARLLMAVDDELNATFAEDHGLDLLQAVTPGATHLDLGALAGDGEARLRWTLLRSGNALQVEHQVVPLPPRAQRGHDQGLLALPVPPPGGFAALLVENLEEGTWGWYRKDGF